VSEEGERVDLPPADSAEVTPPTTARKPLRKVILALIVAVGALAALVVASPAFAASPAPSPSSGSTTHTCPNM
jgi:hypothetical protein